MLKKRILTAFLLLPLVVLAIVILTSTAFTVISALVFLPAIWEWTYLAGFKTRFTRMGGVILIPLTALSFLVILQIFGNKVLQEGVPLLIVAFWLLVLVVLYQYPKGQRFWKSKIVGLLAGCMVLIPTWAMLVALQYVDPRLILYVLALIWSADTAAYFVGKRFGKNKLAFHISPGKTWEGVFGGLIASLVVIGLGYLSIQTNLSLLSWFILGIITFIFSIVGDLFESAYKRIRQIKDSSSLLPGHGGMLDRIDSMTAALPMFAVGFIFFN